MWRLNIELSLKTRFVIFNFFKILLYIVKRKFSLYFVLFIYRLFKSETFLSFSTLIKKIFAKTHNFDSYDVIMTSYAN